MSNRFSIHIRSGPARESSNNPGAALLVLLCAAHFMDAIDLSCVTVALPSIASEFAPSTSMLGWVVSAYLLGYGGFLLLGGRAADVLGRRRVFLTSVAIFGIASLCATFAPNIDILVACRFVKGVAAGFLAPAALSLITTLWTDRHERGRAIGMFATAGAAGFVGGLVLGGLATQFSWRLAFALPLPFAAAVLLFAPRLLRHQAHQRTRERLDVPGAILITLAFAGALIYLTEGNSLGWASPLMITLLALAVLLTVGFCRRELITAQPLLPLGFLRRRGTATSALTIAALWAAYNGFAFLSTIAMQDILRWSPLQTGLAFVPLGVVNGALAPRIGAFAAKVGVRPVVVTGMVLMTISYLLFLRMGPDAGFLNVILPIMALNGLGLGCAFAPLTLAAFDGVPEKRHGLATSVFNTALQLGGAVGLALITVATAGGAGLSAYPLATVIVVGLSAAGMVGALFLPRRSPFAHR